MICVACAAGHTDILLSYLLSFWSGSSLSRPFGSRIITRSGVILNSLILDFSWPKPNQTRGQPLTNQVHYHHRMKSVTKYSFKHGSLFAICAIEKPARKAACIFSHAHNSGASMAEMWDPRSTEQFRWTTDSECDYPGWITLHYFIEVWILV